MIFELAADCSAALAAMPREHSRLHTLELFEEAIRRDIHFTARHPTTLFQSMWNLCWWVTAPGVSAVLFHQERPLEPSRRNASLAS